MQAYVDRDIAIGVNIAESFGDVRGPQLIVRGPQLIVLGSLVMSRNRFRDGTGHKHRPRFIADQVLIGN